MSDEDTARPKNGGSVKTLAIRLEPDIHAQLSLIAQLRASTITDEIRQAIEAHIESVKANTDLSAKAGDVLADIEREAAARREAIAALFAGDEKLPVDQPPAKATRSRAKTPKEDDAALDG